MMKISPVLITKNAEATIGNTLESLKNFSEVIILDTGSADQTIRICNQFKNVKIYKTDFYGFGKAKNMAAKLAKNNWILSIDADEVLSEELFLSIKNEVLRDDFVYKWQRQNYYRNKQIKYSGWGKEYVTRLYNRKMTAFKNKLVHESLMVENLKVKKLKGNLLHYSYHSISDFTLKREFYSDLFATEFGGKRKSSPFIAVVKSAFDFFNTYIVQLAILDGYRGLLIAISNSYTTFTKYLKLYETNIGYNVSAKNIVTNQNTPSLLHVPDYQPTMVDEKHAFKEVEPVKNKLIA